MDLTKHIRPLSGKTDWPIWKRKIRDLIDYHEGALDVLGEKIVKPEPLEANATAAEVRSHKEKSELYRKANSYAKSGLISWQLHNRILLFTLCHIFGLILGGNADFWALVFFSKNQILGGDADCPIS